MLVFFFLTPPFHPQQGVEKDRWKDMEFYNFMDVPPDLLHSDALPPRPATVYQTGICGHRVHETDGFCSSWPLSIARAEVLVICL